MKWAALCLRNKLLIYLCAITICLAGLFSLYVIPIAPFPALSLDRINISFSYPGANAQTVKTQITSKVEDSLRGLQNIKYIQSISQAGNARLGVTLNSASETELLQAQIKIMQAISSAHLPSVVKQPLVTVSAGSSSLITYVVTSSKKSLFEINNFIQSTLVTKFRGLPGVTLNTADQQPTVHIRLLPERMVKYRLQVSEVSALVNNAFQASPLGSVYLGGQPYQLNLSEEIRSLEGFRNIVVGYRGRPIYLRDIADITFAPRHIFANQISKFNGKNAALLSLFTTTLANPFQISEISSRYLKGLNLPSSLKITAIDNTAEVMKHAFDELTITVLIASGLVLLIALIFLGHLRITLVPIITIPICLLGAICVITMLGFSLNLLTLLAMVIAVGLVVDDAIVVVEKIVCHIEEGMSKRQAVLQGTADISLTVIGITATLLAVYLPIVFCKGSFVQLLQAFAIPLAVAVLISGIVALTLTPIMSLQLISDEEATPYQLAFARILNRITGHYHALLHKILQAPMITLTIIIGLIVLGIKLDQSIPHAYFPQDPDASISIYTTGAAGEPLQSLQKRLQRFSGFYKKDNVKNYDMLIQPDPDTGLMRGKLDINYKDSSLHQIPELKDALDDFIKQQSLQNTYARMQLVSNWGGDYDLQFNLYGADNIKQLQQKVAMLTDIMKKSPLFTNVTNNINKPHKQLAFIVDEVKAAKFGIKLADIKRLLSIYYGGFTLANDFSISGLTVPVVVQLSKQGLQDPKSLEQLQIISPITGLYYSLNKFISTKLVAKPSAIMSFNGHASIRIYATFAKGVSLSDAIPYTEALVKNYAPSLQHHYLGNALSYIESSHKTLFITGLGIFCIYLLLAVLFKNLIDPFTILLTVPFSVVGGALSLRLMGGSLDLYSTLALITLIGLITKHGVLIVQFANAKVESGTAVLDAILSATHDRFRPIIMTTLAMTLGALPLVLSGNTMYVAKRELGLVLIGGLAIGTCFSLFVVPLVYMLLKKR